MTKSPPHGGTTFEVRKLIGGRWLLDSIFDDKQYAIAEAKVLAERAKSTPAIHVVAVSEEDGQFREWTVFKHQMQADERGAGRAASAKSDPSAPSDVSGLRDRDLPNSKFTKRRKTGTWHHYIRVAGGLIVVVGAAVLGVAMLKMLQ